MTNTNKSKRTLAEELEGKSYEEMGEYLDTHSTAEHWDEMADVTEQERREMIKDPVSSAHYYKLDADLVQILQEIAKRKKTTPGALLNEFVREGLKDAER